MTTPRQVSRIWLNKYARPHAPDGKFAPGYIVWTRLPMDYHPARAPEQRPPFLDGTSRVIYYPEIGPDDDLADMRWLADPAHRALVWICVFIVVALIAFKLGWA